MSLLPTTSSIRCIRSVVPRLSTPTVRYASVLAHSNPYAQHSLPRQQQSATAGQKKAASSNASKKHESSLGVSATETHYSSVPRHSSNSSSSSSSISISGADSRVWPTIFRHTGPMPPAPQAIDELQFILGQKPLNMNVPPPQQQQQASMSMGGGRSGGSMEVRTAAEARQKATQQLESLHAVVQNASGILAALSKVAERHLKQNVIHEQQQPTVAPPASPASVASAVVVQEDPAASQSNEHVGSKRSAANAVLLAMFLSGSGVGVYFGSVLLSANIV